MARAGTNHKGGRPPKAKEKQVINLVSPYIENAISTVIDILENSTRDSDRLKAAELLLAYRFGKPRTQIDVVSSDNSVDIKPVQFIDAEIVEEKKEEKS